MTSECISLVVTPSSFERLKTGNVFGEIYLDYGSGQFPARGWTDFVLRVSTWWLDAIYSLHTKAGDRGQVYFMDGPFRIDLSIDPGDVITLRLVEDRRTRENIHPELRVESRVVLADAVSAAGRILAECRLRGWQNKDFLALEDLYEGVRSEVR